MLAAGLVALAPQAAQAAPGSKTFLTSGGLNQDWVVPNDVHSLDIKVNGAAGGAGGLEGGSGGRGASGTVTVPVTPGQLITVYLGRRGGDAHPDNPLIEGGGGTAAGAAVGGPGGEGRGGSGAGGGGGGATEVFVGAGLDRAIVAGGGGGGGGNTFFANTPGGNGGGADEDGQAGANPEAEGGHPGDAPTQAGGTGDSAIGFVGGGAGGGGGGYQGGSQGATFASSSGAGGGGGRSYVNPLLGELQGSWSNSSEGDGSVVITYLQAFTTTTTIANPGVTVTQELKRYDVHVAGNGGQTPKGTVTLVAKNNGNGTITGFGQETIDSDGNASFFADLDAEKLKVGTYTLTAEFTPAPGSDSLPSTGKEALTVVKGSTQTLISAPLDPPDFGDEATLGVSVTPLDPAGGVPTGKVQFYAGGQAVDNPVTLDALGQAQLTTKRLPVGSYELTAQYTGDKEFEGSASNIIAFVVNKGGVSVELTSVHNPNIVGEKSRFQAVVKSTKDTTKKPTGTVQFFNNGEPIGAPQPVNAVTGVATLDWNLAVTSENGHHHVTALYSGDDNFNEATSNYVDQIVNIASAKVKLTSDINPSKAGETVTFSVDVDGKLLSGHEPTGEVQLFVNGTAFNSPKVIDADGKVTFDSADLPVGANNVTAQYLGDDNFDEAWSAPLIQVVEQQEVTVVLTASDTDLQYGETLTLTTQVIPDDGSQPTGTVTFTDNGIDIGTVDVDANGQAVLEIKKPTKGVHQYGSYYSGSDKNLDGTSNTVQVTVHKNTVKVTVATSGLPAYEKRDVILHVRLDAVGNSLGKIEGIVQFYSNHKKIGGSVPVSGTGGGSRVIHGGFKPGYQRIVAKFIPKTQSLYEIAVSDTVIQRTRSGKPNAKVNMSVRRTAVDAGKVNVSVRRTSNNTGVSGKVRIYLDGKPYKYLTLSGGKATTYVTGLPDRGVLVSASYLGKGKVKSVSTERGLQRF